MRATTRKRDLAIPLGKDDWDRISYLDILPDDIAEQMAGSAARNKIIVDTYKKNKDTYGKTIVFAVNVVHAKSEKFNFIFAILSKILYT